MSTICRVKPVRLKLSNNSIFRSSLAICLLLTLISLSFSVYAKEKTDILNWESPSSIQYSFQSSETSPERKWRLHFFANSEILIEDISNNINILMLPNGMIATHGVIINDLKFIDQAILSSKLLTSLIRKSLPSEYSLDSKIPYNINVQENTLALTVKTASAEGIFKAPWAIKGQAHIKSKDTAFTLEFSSVKHQYHISFKGKWINAPAGILAENTSLAEWNFSHFTVEKSTQDNDPLKQYTVLPVNIKFDTLLQLRKFELTTEQE